MAAPWNAPLVPFGPKSWRSTEHEIKEILYPQQGYDETNKPRLGIFIAMAWNLTNDIIRFECESGTFDGVFKNGRRGWLDCRQQWCEGLPYQNCGGQWQPCWEGIWWPWGLDRHKQIELLLACHFYKLSDRSLQSESVNGASGTFMGSAGMGFDATQYGQMAKRIDKSGYLMILDERKVAFGGITAPGAKADISYIGTN